MVYIKRPSKLVVLLALAVPWLFSLPASATNEWRENQINRQCLPHPVYYPKKPCQTIKGCYLDIQPSIGGEITVTSPLLAGYKTPQLLPRTRYKDYQVSTANLIRNDGVMIGELI